MVVTYVQTQNEPAAQVQAVQTAEPPTVDELFRLVNEERAKVGVAPLVLDPLLNQSAQMKADELSIEGWDDTPHINDAGKHGWDYINDVNKTCITASENLLHDAITSTGGLLAWMNSPAHKNAILNPTYDSVGYGIKNGFVAQHFCNER